MARNAMTHIEIGMGRLATLVEDIINLTKMKLTDIPTKDVILSKVIDETLESVEHMENYSSIEIDIDNQVAEPLSTKKLL